MWPVSTHSAPGNGVCGLTQLIVRSAPGNGMCGLSQLIVHSAPGKTRPTVKVDPPGRESRPITPTVHAQGGGF